MAHNSKPYHKRETSTSRGYDARWRKARVIYLRSHPYCKDCMKQSILTPAQVIDHIKPHKGNQALFWNESNWQALCKHCHDSHKQRYERSGKVIGCNTEGLPVDQAHHWYKSNTTNNH